MGELGKNFKDLELRGVLFIGGVEEEYFELLLIFSIIALMLY